jgi:hypothetical protein
MVSLADARNDAKLALEGADLRVFTHAPEVASGRFCVVAPSDPYLSSPTEPIPFRNYQLDLLVLAVVEKGDNEATDAALDAHVQDVVVALATSPYDVVTVTGHGEYAMAGTTVAGVVIEIRSFINLGE